MFSLGILAQTAAETHRQRLNAFEEERIDLCAEHEDQAHHVEQQQDDNHEAQLAHIITHELMHVHGKEENEQLQSNRRHQRPAPPSRETRSKRQLPPLNIYARVSEVHLAFGHHAIDQIEQGERQQAAEDAHEKVIEALVCLHQCRNRRHDDNERREYDEDEENLQSLNILIEYRSFANPVDDGENVVDAHEQPRAGEDGEDETDAEDEACLANDGLDERIDHVGDALLGKRLQQSIANFVEKRPIVAEDQNDHGEDREKQRQDGDEQVVGDERRERKRPVEDELQAEESQLRPRLRPS